MKNRPIFCSINQFFAQSELDGRGKIDAKKARWRSPAGFLV
jgi:hypothetical protein